MDPAALLFAAASLPILIYNAVWYKKERQIGSIYGTFSGIFAFSGALLVVYGFPGYAVMPGTFAILALGAAHAYIREKERPHIIRMALFSLVSAGFLALAVIL